MKDARDLTIRDLAAIVDQMDGLPVDAKEYRRLNDQIAIASLYLQDSGALARLLWWAKDIEPNAPPDAKADVVEFKRPEPRPPFLVR
jgi:hypothetical protein